mmetsp:Transcript_21287/g.68686  ORF Transcript_21287/g.68686 Transcript_21287/m.68686 type:complete len:362 (+) Transcript_21287:1-1086(+)
MASEVGLSFQQPSSRRLEWGTAPDGSTPCPRAGLRRLLHGHSTGLEEGDKTAAQNAVHTDPLLRPLAKHGAQQVCDSVLVSKGRQGGQPVFDHIPLALPGLWLRQQFAQSHLQKHAPQPPHVRHGAIRGRIIHFGCHIHWGPDNAHVVFEGGILHTNMPSKSKVGQLEHALVDQHVLRLDVPVNDPILVAVLERRGQLRERGEQPIIFFPAVRGPLAEQAVQVATVAVLEHNDHRVRVNDISLCCCARSLARRLLVEEDALVGDNVGMAGHHLHVACLCQRVIRLVHVANGDLLDDELVPLLIVHEESAPESTLAQLLDARVAARTQIASAAHVAASEQFACQFLLGHGALSQKGPSEQQQ